MGSIPSSRALLEVRILFIFYNGYLLFVQTHVPYACVRMIAAHRQGSAAINYWDTKCGQTRKQNLDINHVVVATKTQLDLHISYHTVFLTTQKIERPYL